MTTKRLVALGLGLLGLLTACSGHGAFDQQPVVITVTASPSAAPSTSTSSSAATTTTTPTTPPLDRASVDKVFKAYMDALTGHDMTAFRASVCPEYRNTLEGFALHGYYISRYTMLPYDLFEGADFVTVRASVTQKDPTTGRSAGDVTYSWNVEREADQNYYVCGWLD